MIKSCEQKRWRKIVNENFEEKNVNKNSEESCEKDVKKLWAKVVNKWCEQKSWAKFVNNSCWHKLFTKFVEKSCKQNLLTKVNRNCKNKLWPNLLKKDIDKIC